MNWIEALRRRPSSVSAANHDTYLYKFIWLGCVSVCIPVILASLVYYQLSMNRAKQQMANESQSSLIMIKDRAERILQGIEQESLQLAVDPILATYFRKQNGEFSLIWHKEFLDQISLVKNSDSFIDEIYFYNSAEDIVLSNRYGAIAKQSYRYKADIERFIAEGKLSQWAFMPVGRRDGYVTFARLLPILGSAGPQGMLAFEIKTDAISRFLQTDTFILPRGQDLFVLNYQRLLAGGSKDATDIYTALSQLDSMEAIRASDKSTDSFYAKGVDGEPALYLYLKNIFGRTYVTVIPEKIVAERFNWIRWGTLLVLIFFVAVGVLLAYLNTKKAYNPIEQLMKQAEKLGAFMEQIEPTLREKCLQQLVSGDYTTVESLMRDCQTYGIALDTTNVVLIADAENIAKDKRFLPGEKGIIAFAIANVMQELLHANARIRGYALPLQGRGIALLQFVHGTEQAGMLRQTMDYAHSVCASLKSCLSFDISVGIGRFYSHAADVPVSFKEAETALQYRLFRVTEHVLFIDNLEHAKTQTSFRYPRETESAVVQALETGELQEAAGHLSEFVEVLRSSQSYTFIYQSYYMLLASVIASLERQGGHLLDILEHNLFGQLQNKQTSQEIYDWFVESLFPLYKWLTDHYRSAAGPSVINQVCKYIKENCNKDLSLVQCADMAGMSPSYLSRMFKKEMGMNFLDYVVECKVAEAKRLLVESNRSVSDISTAIGYSERNLNRVFQRYTRMTPSAFRTRHR